MTIVYMPCRQCGFLLALVATLLCAAAATAEDLVSEPVHPSGDPLVSRIGRYVQTKAEQFSQSDLEFSRSRSNAPFLPISFLSSAHYGDATVREVGGDGGDPRFQQTSTSVAGGLPFLLGPSDGVVLGFYANHSRFKVDNPGPLVDDEFDVTVGAVALGYLKQLNPDWQLMGFLMPLHNDSDLAGGASYWQTMGGAFARYTASDRLWWMAGVFADTSPYDRYWLPYLGFSWTLSERWTVSGVLPWPQVIYAPSRDWFVGVGGALSGSGWAVDLGSGAVNMDLNAFDLGVHINRRIYGVLWGSLSAGVGGLRALQIESGTDIEGPEFAVSSSPFVRIEFTVRPGDLF
ncbi:MAG: hypothetical protein PVJ95_01495 [Cellvibrionales bacterium]